MMSTPQMVGQVQAEVMNHGKTPITILIVDLQCELSQMRKTCCIEDPVLEIFDLIRIERIIGIKVSASVELGGKCRIHTKYDFLFLRIPPDFPNPWKSTSFCGFALGG